MAIIKNANSSLFENLNARLSSSTMTRFKKKQHLMITFGSFLSISLEFHDVKLNGK